MWSVVVVEVLEAVDEGIDVGEVSGQVVDSIELVSPTAIAALDGAVHFWGFGRQDIEADVSVLAGLLEIGLELRSAVDLDGAHREGHVAQELVEEEGCRGCGGAIEGLGDGPFGDRVISGEMLDGFVWSDIDGNGVELDEAAGTIAYDLARQAHRIAALGARAAAGSRPPQGRDRGHHTASHQAADDAIDGRVRDREAFGPQQRANLGAAPHREILAQPFDCPDHGRGPCVDGSWLASAFFTLAALVGAAMCSAC